MVPAPCGYLALFKGFIFSKPVPITLSQKGRAEMEKLETERTATLK